MPKKSAPLPDWFPLDSYSMNLTPTQWAIQLDSRRKFYENYISLTAPDWQDDEKKQQLKLDCEDLPTTWKKYFVSTGNPYDHDFFGSEISLTDFEMYFNSTHDQYKQNIAVGIMRGVDALRLAAALSENQELLVSTFQGLASLYESSLLQGINSDEVDKRLDNLRIKSPMIYLAVLATMGKKYSRKAAIKRQEPYRDKTYLECLFENASSSTLFTQANFDSSRLWVGLDTELDDEAILDELRQKLPRFRGKKKPTEKITQNELDKWKSYGILQIFDLEIWGLICNLDFTDNLIAEAIWPFSEIDNTVNRLRKTAKPKMQEVFSSTDIVRRLNNTKEQGQS